jgi:acetylornithine deacetylase
MPELTALVRQLIAIPSVNPSIAPREGTGERAIAEWIVPWFWSQGIHARIEGADPGRPNVVAELLKGDGPTLVLCAHLDTVGTEGMTIKPFEAAVEKSKLFGRGAYDMKASVAAIMMAMRQLKLSKFRGSVVAALVADEEYASAGALDFVSRYRADACIVTEPTEGRLVLGHKGFVWATVTTSGVAAHGSRWDLGVSAIGRMGRIIAAFEEFDRVTLRRRSHPLIGQPSMHCALINGGSGLSTYAAECSMQIERRTIPGESTAQVLAELQQQIADARETATVTISFDRPPLECDRDAQIVSSVRAALRAITSREPEIGGFGFWTDAAIFAAAGVPTVIFGPSGGDLHGAAEWVDMKSVAELTRVLVDVAQRYSGTVGD